MRAATAGGRGRAAKRVVLSEGVLRLIVEGKVRVIRDRKLRYGKYRIVRRYVAER